MTISNTDIWSVERSSFPQDWKHSPGRIDSGIASFGSASDLANAFRRAETAHGEHEKRTGERDANWPDWYAQYMVAEQAGTDLPI